MSFRAIGWTDAGRPGNDVRASVPPSRPTTTYSGMIAVTNAELGLPEEQGRRSNRIASQRATAGGLTDSAPDDMEEDMPQRGGKRKKDEEDKNYDYVSPEKVAGLPEQEINDIESSCEELSDDEIQALMECKQFSHKKARRKRSDPTSPTSDTNEGAADKKQKRQLVLWDNYDSAEEDDDDEESEAESTSNGNKGHFLVSSGGKGKRTLEDCLHHDSMTCFGCMWGNRDVDAVKKNVFDQCMRIIEENLGCQGTPIPTVAKIAHEFFKQEIFGKMRAEGKKIPMWRTRSIYGHIVSSREPRITTLLQLRDTFIMQYGLRKMVFKQHKTPENMQLSEEKFIHNPMALKGWLEAQKRIFEIYKTSYKSMLYFNDSYKIDTAAQGRLVNIHKKWEMKSGSTR